VTILKKQTGIWIDGQVWRAYRDLCGREKLRPAEPIEEYVRLHACIIDIAEPVWKSFGAKF
jgi:hypothetical protein